MWEKGLHSPLVPPLGWALLSEGAGVQAEPGQAASNGAAAVIVEMRLILPKPSLFCRFWLEHTWSPIYRSFKELIQRDCFWGSDPWKPCALRSLLLATALELKSGLTSHFR